MKKLVSVFLAGFLFLVVACSSGAESVAEKIDKKEKLDQKDYTEMLQYVETAVDDVSATIEKYKDHPDKLKEEAEKIEDKYPYFEKFTSNMPQESELDQANKQKLHDLTMKIIKMSMEAPIL